MVCRATPPSLCFGDGDEEDGPVYFGSIGGVLLPLTFVALHLTAASFLSGTCYA